MRQCDRNHAGKKDGAPIFGCRPEEWKDDQSGSIIVLVLILLVMVTVLGTATINNSTLEVQIMRNEFDHKRNFNLAEAATREAGQLIENEDTDQLGDTSYPLIWLKNYGTTDMDDPANWDDTTNCKLAASDPDNNTLLAAVYLGVKAGTGAEMGSPKIHEYAVYGLHESNRGMSHIQAGYRRKF